MIAIDMERDETGQEQWREVTIPYLNSMHFSPVTAIAWTDHIPQATLDALGNENLKFFESSADKWFINGGVNTNADSETESAKKSLTASSNSVVITGHWNGTVAFWKIEKTGVFTPLGSFTTLGLYDEALLTPGCLVNREQLETIAWPPFRYAGLNRRYPHSSNAYPAEDFRAAISRIEVVDKPHESSSDSQDEAPNLVISTLGGHCHVWAWQSREQSIKNSLDKVCNLRADILAERPLHQDAYVWQDRDPLPVRRRPILLGSALSRIHGCYQANCIVSMNPPAPVLCTCYYPVKDMLAVGNALAIVVVNCGTAEMVKCFCLLPENPQDLIAVPPSADSSFKAAISLRGKQISENLRHSVKKIKKIIPKTSSFAGKSKETDKPATDSTEKKPEEEIADATEAEATTSQEPATNISSEDDKVTSTKVVTTRTVVSTESHHANGGEDESSRHVTTTTTTTTSVVKTTNLGDQIEAKSSTVAEDAATAEAPNNDQSPTVTFVGHETTTSDSAAAAPPPEQPPQPHPLTSADLYLVSCRAVHLTSTFVRDKDATPVVTLIHGTQRGVVSLHSICNSSEISTVPPKEDASHPSSEAVHQNETPAESVPQGWLVKLEKQLTLQHGSSVIGLAVMVSKVHQLACGGGPCSKSHEAAATDENAVEKDTPHEVMSSGDQAHDGEQDSSMSPTPATGVDSNVAPAAASSKKCSSDKAKVDKSSASFAHAHELLVCTEEQVKVLSLPSLTTKHKHKVSYLFSHSENQPPLSSGTSDTSFGGRSMPRSPTGTLMQSGSSQTMSSAVQVAGRRIHSYSLQLDPVSNQRLLVLQLTNGQFQVLSLHQGLMKFMTGSYLGSLQHQPACVALCLATAVSVHSNNHCLLLAQPFLGELLCTEFSLNAGAAQPGFYFSAGSGYALERDAVTEPEPVAADPDTDNGMLEEEPEAETATNTSAAQATQLETSGSPAAVVTSESACEGVEHEEQVTVSAAVPVVHSAVSSSSQKQAEAVNGDGETTTPLLLNGTHQEEPMEGIESIKKYIKSTSDSTVHTVERCVEHKTVISEGRTVTTVHEKTVVDGEVIKDDTICKPSCDSTEPAVLTN